MARHSRVRATGALPADWWAQHQTACQLGEIGAMTTFPSTAPGRLIRPANGATRSSRHYLFGQPPSTDSLTALAWGDITVSERYRPSCLMLKCDTHTMLRDEYKHQFILAHCTSARSHPRSPRWRTQEGLGDVPFATSVTSLSGVDRVRQSHAQAWITALRQPVRRRRLERPAQVLQQ